MSAAAAVHFVVPLGVDDPVRVSGGNVYDLRVRAGLEASGWDVRLLPVATDAAASVLSRIDDGAVVLIDGLVAGRSSDAVVAEAERLRIVVLAHMVSAEFPDAAAEVVRGEQRAFASAVRIVTPSAWTRRQIVEAGLAREDAVVVAHPGAEDAAPARGSDTGTALLCLGVVAPHKGQDVLIDALARLDPGRDWSCTIAGSLETEPGFARTVRDRAVQTGVADRVRFAGVLTGSALEDAYRTADLVVAPSRVENFGIVVADALRRGIPVVASDTGGIPEATGGTPAAVLVPPGDPAALAEVLGRWVTDPGLRSRLTAEARRDRLRVPGWSETATRIAEALEEAR